MTVFENFLKNYGVFLRAAESFPEMYRDRRFGPHQNLVSGNPCDMKWLNGYRMRLVLTGVVTVIVLSVSNAWGAYFQDDFDRPDGEVGNGWIIWTRGGIEPRIVDNEVLIAGQQGGDWKRSGIYRPVEDETRFSFDFKADDRFNVHIELYDPENYAGNQIDFYAWPGGPFFYNDGGWNEIPGSRTIAGQYNNLVVEQEGAEFTLTLNGQVIGTVTKNKIFHIGEVFIASDASAGTVGSLHIDNVQIGISEQTNNPSPEDGALDQGTGLTRFTFGEPTNLGPTVNTAAHECFSTISSDGLELYFFDLDFLRPSGLGGWDIWVTRRSSISDPWGEPANLGPAINSEYDDGKPSISADGLTLYFSSNRPGGYGEFDVWMSTRSTIADDWGAPVNLGEPVNSSADEIFPCVSPDGLELYFNEWGAFRPDGYGEGDIWVARRTTTDEPWGEPVNPGETINSPYYDSCPYLSPDGLLLFLHGWRPGGPGPEDMWVSTRSSMSDAWSAVVPLPWPINGRQIDGCPGVSADGSTFYFASLRSDGSGMADTWQAPIIPIVDFNGDGHVDDGDVDILNTYMGTDESLCDIGPMPWGDGIVDEADLNVLMSHWGQEVHYLAKRASLPTSFDQGVSDVEQARFLSWWPGSDASEHDVYVGTDSTAVENADTSDATGVYRGRQQASEYTLPEEVLPGQTYYWRIDEWNANGTLTRGELWSFSVTDYLFVDDMEASDDPMWFIWWDGWGDPNNGSEVWYPEANIVRGGEQSMYLVYDNSTAPTSQILRVWETPQDWTRKGVETLSLWFHGDTDNTAEPLQIFLGDSADNAGVIVHPDPAVLVSDTWQQWSIPLTDVTGVNLSEVTSMTIVIGDDATEEGGTGVLYIDDICLHPAR